MLLARGSLDAISIAVDFEDRLGERLRRFLRQVVSNAAMEGAMSVSARELLCVGARGRMRSAVGIAFKGYRRDRDDRKLCEPFFQDVILALALRRPQAPAIVMNYDADVIRVVERGRGAIESGVIEVPSG